MDKFLFRNAASVGLFFLTALLFMYLTMPRGVKPYDEGIILTGAMRVAAGETIHRDFYANYGPGQFYILAWLFKMFGQKVLVLRLLDNSVRAGILVLAYFSTKPYVKNWISIALTASLALWLGLVGSKGYPIYPALLFSIASTLMAAKAMQSRHSIVYPLASGFLVGIVALFRYDAGFFLLVSHILSSTAILLLEPSRPDGPAAVNLKCGLFYLGGVASVGLTVALTYLNAGITGAFIHDIVAFPSRYYASNRGLPFPDPFGLGLVRGLGSLAIYLPVATFLSVLAASVGKPLFFPILGTRVESREDAHRNFIVFFAFLAAAFYVKGMVRVGVDQVQLSLIPAVMALSAYYGLADQRKHWIRFVLAGLVALTAVSAASVVFQTIIDMKDHLLDRLQKSGGRPQSTVTKGTANPRLAPIFKVDPDRSSAIDYLIKHTKPSERIFVGVSGHDKIYENDVSAYFLTGRLPATKWHHFDPGLQTSAEIQSEMVAEFEVTKPRYIWLETTWNGISEPNDSSKSSGIHILDRYINANYEVVKEFGAITILRRKCAAPGTSSCESP